MTINLSEVEFEQDFFEIEVPAGGYIYLNKIDESLKISDTYDEKIDSINIVYVDDNGNQTLCSSIIGIDNAYFSLTTDYEEYEGEPLSSSSLPYCTMEIADE